ncbi:MAG: hypothetical protein ACI8U4_000560 [Natronomonas sp.]|jgi:hypothetical protein
MVAHSDELFFLPGDIGRLLDTLEAALRIERNQPFPTEKRRVETVDGVVAENGRHELAAEAAPALVGRDDDVVDLRVVGPVGQDTCRSDEAVVVPRTEGDAVVDGVPNLGWLAVGPPFVVLVEVTQRLGVGGVEFDDVHAGGAFPVVKPFLPP